MSKMNKIQHAYSLCLSVIVIMLRFTDLNSFGTALEVSTNI